MSITYDQARLRNLKIKVLKILLEKGDVVSNLNMLFNEEILESEFYFQKSDILKYKEELFESNGQLKTEVKEELEGYIEQCQRIDRALIEADTKKFSALYLEMEESLRNFNFDDDLIEKNLREIKTMVKNLHWFYLPIYDEQFILNREVIPETDLVDFYNHYHTIEDLYRWITNHPQSVKWKSLAGDFNLNKELKLKIYTCRWGHYDHYTMLRTIDGWKILSMQGEIHCKVDGSGASIREGYDKFETGIYSILYHDSVQYPKEGVARAFELLWNEADSTEMTVDVLQKKIDDISDWISSVEKVVHKKQPIWCDYY